MLSQQEINELWTLRSDNYNNYIEGELTSSRAAEWLQAILDQAPTPGRPLDILDCGCGPGFFSILLSKAGHHVTGIDLADRMLDHARENAARTGTDPVFRHMDCADLQLEDCSIDLAVSRNLTHIFQDHLKVYREWFRVLRPGGVLLIFDANWHLPYIEGPVREEAIENERRTLEKYGSNFSCEEEGFEYIGSPLHSREHQPLGDSVRPEFDLPILRKAGFRRILFDLDVTEKLYSEKEKLMYHATPMFMIRAEKKV